MNATTLKLKPICAALMLASVLSACGGGGGDSPTAASNTGATSTGSGTSTGTGTGTSGTGTGTGTSGTGTGSTGSTTLAMSCVDGAGYQCSGDTILGTDNGIAYTASGVQAYAKSTSDLAANNPNTTVATGFAPASGGVAELRVKKDASGNVTAPTLLLKNLGISWDGKTERPQIIESFLATAGRSELAANGALNTAIALPASSDTSFYDFVTLNEKATQAHYANNRYFPRAQASRCPAGSATCPTQETSGVNIIKASASEDWRTGGTGPDYAGAERLHEDGDIHAGDGTANGTGPGVPFPGSKGFRSLDHWSYQYSNLGGWYTADTVDTTDWMPTSTNEHVVNRRGILAYGDVTAAASVPTTGTANYSGVVHGWYSANGSGEPSQIFADAVITVNFATHVTTVKVQNAVVYDGSNTPVPVTLDTATTIGAGAKANYFTGVATSGALTGGVSGRFFGPVNASNTVPVEVGGTLSLKSASGAAVVAGFIGRKQ